MIRSLKRAEASAARRRRRAAGVVDDDVEPAVLARRRCRTSAVDRLGVAHVGGRRTSTPSARGRAGLVAPGGDDGGPGGGEAVGDARPDVAGAAGDEHDLAGRGRGDRHAFGRQSGRASPTRAAADGFLTPRQNRYPAARGHHHDRRRPRHRRGRHGQPAGQRPHRRRLVRAGRHRSRALGADPAVRVVVLRAEGRGLQRRRRHQGDAGDRGLRRPDRRQPRAATPPSPPSTSARCR